MDALDRYLETVRKRLRAERPDAVLPDFSRDDTRTGARVLLMFQDPGHSGAAKTGETSRNNPDPSAAAIRQTEDVLPPELAVSWNAIPWAQQKPVGEELTLVREWGLIPELLDALPRVRAVVLCGGVAHRLTVDFHEYAHNSEERDLLVLHGPHPSTRGLNDRWFGRGARKRWLRRVVKQARDHADPANNG